MWFCSSGNLIGALVSEYVSAESITQAMGAAHTAIALLEEKLKSGVRQLQQVCS